MRRLLIPLVLALLSGPLQASPEEYQQARAAVQDWQERYPKLIQVRSLGKSRGGRQLTLLRISASSRQDLPGMFFGAGIHGHEKSELVALEAIRRLLKRSKQPAIRKLLEQRVLWVQLMMNPDGVFAHRRHNDAQVDLNRNFGFLWGKNWGKEGIPAKGHRTYPGPSAFSEPESRALRRFLRTERGITVFVDCHRSAKLVLLPVGAKPGSKLPAEYWTLHRGLVRAMPGFNRTRRPPRITAFLTGSGYAVDWTWGALGIYSFVWECPYGAIKAAQAKVYLSGLLHLLQQAGAMKRPRWRRGF